MPFTPSATPTSDADREPPVAADGDPEGALLRTLSHDLRTPLAAILGLAATLEREDIQLDPGETHDIARRIGANARRLDRMVDDLVDLDGLRRGAAPPTLVETDIGALVSEVVATADWLEGHEVEAVTPSVRASVDRPMVERIVERLLENAVRHAPEASPIRILVERGEAHVTIAVDDHGPGVPPAERDRVFRATGGLDDAQPRRAAGMGVALALVAALAGLHGGGAWVQDAEGGGASFRVRLPLVASRSP